MAEEKITNIIVEESADKSVAIEVLERIQRVRGNFLRGIDVLKKNGSKRYITTNFNATNKEPIGTMIEVANSLSYGYDRGVIDVEYSSEAVESLGIYEIGSLSRSEILKLIENHEMASGNIQSFDRARVGLIDLTSFDPNEIKLGEINLLTGQLSSVRLDRNVI